MKDWYDVGCDGIVPNAHLLFDLLSSYNVCAHLTHLVWYMSIVD